MQYVVKLMQLLMQWNSCSYSCSETYAVKCETHAVTHAVKLMQLNVNQTVTKWITLIRRSLLSHFRIDGRQIRVRHWSCLASTSSYVRLAFQSSSDWSMLWTTLNENYWTKAKNKSHQYVYYHTVLLHNGSVAQWIRRLPTEQEIVGSSPAWVKLF